MKPLDNQEYETLIQPYLPKSPILKNVAFAFLIGGGICALGQVITNIAKSMGADTSQAAAVTSVTLIFLSALFTGLTLYQKLARFAGAGTVVPITGFANSMVSPAIEYQSEGYVMGVGAKMFTIAGPVIVYGILSGVLAGILYYFVR